MNLFFVTLVSVILATGVFNTEPKDSEVNKKTEIIVKDTLKKKSAEEKVKSEEKAQAEAEAKAAAEAQAQAEAEAKAAAEAQAQAEAEAQKESKEIDSSKDSGTNYLRLALYIFASILVISLGAYLYFRQRDNSPSRSVTRTPDSSRRDFRREVVAEPQEEQPTQEEVKTAFRNNELNTDAIIVVRFQGPKANGMPELHGLTPILAVLQDRGLKVALITDGRMSGASGKVPAAIHLSPEAANLGPISKIKNGDLIRLDARSGELNILDENFELRESRKKDLSENERGLGRELFNIFRENATAAKFGGGIT